MSIITGWLIPSDRTQAVRRVSYDTTDYTNLTALIFNGDRGGTFDCATLESPHHDGEERIVSLWFDDDGLQRLDSEKIVDIVNLRAMELWAHLEGVTVHDFAVPLIGDYVILGGVDQDGESLSAPDWPGHVNYTWHHRYHLTDSN